MNILIFIIFLIFSNVRPEEPILPSCQINKPFKLRDNKCSSFSDVCVKANDPECRDLLNACKECPPSNYTTLMFSDIRTMQVQMLIVMWCIVALNIVLLLVCLVEIRFKLITKFCEFCTGKGQKINYRKLKLGKYKNGSEAADQIPFAPEEEPEICVSWQKASKGHIPARAVKAGKSCFVGRAQHNKEWIPGKLFKGHKGVYICHGGKEIFYEDYEVLVETNVLHKESVQWSRTYTPKRAIVGGSESGKPLYIARSNIEDEAVVGKYLSSNGYAYFPYGDIEHKTGFEVLCYAAKPV